MIRFYGLRLLKDYIGHAILIGLPVALIYLMVTISQEANHLASTEEIALYIGIIYILMFQGFGAAFTFEGLEKDFFSPFKTRLLASPVNPMKFVWANILFSAIVSFLQGMVLIVYLIVVFGVRIPNWGFVLPILFLGVIFAQLFGALLIFLTKKANKSQALLVVYIIVSMLVAGFFMPLPNNNFTEFLSKYSSPMSWTHHALIQVMDGSYMDALIGVSLLLVTILVLVSLVIRLSKRVIL